jgi:tRNA threonylcarbamoyladenosine biosynthesis protein TsaB
MEKIILIETSTALCSVALAEGGAITAYRESSAAKAHASLTAVFVQEVLQERGLKLEDCDAVCVSMGPGSYTGLRVGVSTAKGLCFGSGKPLIAVGTLDTLVAQAYGEIAGQAGNDENDGNDGYRFIIPMIDARRMEVYTAVFDKTVMQGEASHVMSSEVTHVMSSEAETSVPYKQITETAPAIIDGNSFSEYLEQGPVLFIGDGAGKCADVIKHPNAHFCQCHPKASSMLAPAMEAYRADRFQDVAYFEPFYLKEFVATVSKKKLF